MTVQENTDIGRQLAYLIDASQGQNPLVAQNKTCLLKCRFGTIPEEIQGGRQKLAANMGNGNGWYPNNQGVGNNDKDIENETGFENAVVNNEVFILFQPTALTRNNGMIRMDNTAKYIHSNRFYNAATLEILRVEHVSSEDGDEDGPNKTARYEGYRDKSVQNRFCGPGESDENFQMLEPHFFNTESLPDEIFDNLLAARISQEFLKTGYMQSICDPFWTHIIRGRDPNGDRVLYPNATFATSLDEWTEYLAELEPIDRPDAIFDELNRLIYEVDTYLADGTIPTNGGVIQNDWHGIVHSLVQPDGATVVDEDYDDEKAAEIVDTFRGHLQTRHQDPLFENIKECLEWTPSVASIPDTVYDETRIEIRKGLIQDLVLRENLFTIGGLTEFRPSSIFSPIPILPGLIQDFTLTTSKEKTVKVKNFSRLSSAVTLELSPQPSFELEMFSQDSFDQNDKSLQSCELKVPNIVRYEKQFNVSDDGEYKIPFESHRGAPDKIFFHIERVSKKGEVYDMYQPTIEEIRLEHFSQDVKTISDLNKYQIYEATRRNSNVRTDVLENRMVTGGVLLSTLDFGNWSRYDLFFPQDNFQGEFIIRESFIQDVEQHVDDRLQDAEKRIRNEQIYL